MLINFGALLSRNTSEEQHFSPQEQAVHIFLFYFAPNFRGEKNSFLFIFPDNRLLVSSAQ